MLNGVVAKPLKRSGHGTAGARGGGTARGVRTPAAEGARLSPTHDRSLSPTLRCADRIFASYLCFGVCIIPGFERLCGFKRGWSNYMLFFECAGQQRVHSSSSSSSMQGRSVESPVHANLIPETQNWPFSVLRFWDKNTGICAGVMPYRLDFPAPIRM